MSDDSDKTEEPSEHKLQEAKRKGQVLKSQEIISTFGLLACVGLLIVTGDFMYDNMATYTRITWQRIANPDVIGIKLLPELIEMSIVVFVSIIPMLMGVFVMAIFSNVAQIKFIFTFETMKPSLSKINPIEGFKKIFSMKSIVELLKQLAKLAVIGYLSWKAVVGDLDSFAEGPHTPLKTSADLVWILCQRAMFYTVGGMVVIAALDYAWQRHSYLKQMKMSHQDMKDEYKETEGNPQVKGKIRQMMRQGAQARMSEEVPNASAVVTNPTHMAVAIRYKKGEDQIPIVVAKGENVKAQQIKVLAEDHEIPIIENVELARALFGACKIGQGIPTELYKAVAEILAYVMKLKRKKQMRSRRR